MPNITPLPIPPTRQDPENFNERADDFLSALESPFVPELNALRTEVLNAQSSANTSASNAATSASSATTSANTASTQAGIATTQAGIATTKASEALASANNAAASFDAFDDRYLGSKTSNPTVDNDGQTLLVGALYFNSGAGEMRVWNGTAWVASYLPASGYVTLNGTETLTNKTLTNPIINGFTGNTGVINIGSGQFVKDASGNVGIGLSNPAHKLQVGGTISSTSQVTEWHTSSSFQYTASSSTHIAHSKVTSNDHAYYWRTTDDGSPFGTNSKALAEFYNNRLVFFTENQERMRIDSAGNVGIGTSSPGGALTVARAGTVDVQIVAGATGSTELVQYGGNNVARHVFAAGGQTPYVNSFEVLQVQGGDAFLINRANNHMAFATNNQERIRIDASGQLKTMVTGGSAVMDTYGCRAWVNFNGTGTVAIRASGNVSSITDNGTGIYTVNFTTAMPDENYAVVSGSTQSEVNSPSFNSPSQTTSSFNLQTRASGGSLSDPVYVTIAVFR
jgi:hypothetical protein